MFIYHLYIYCFRTDKLTHFCPKIFSVEESKDFEQASHSCPPLLYLLKTLCGGGCGVFCGFVFSGSSGGGGYCTFLGDAGLIRE